MATDFKEHFTGLSERRLDTDFCHIRVHYSADPEKDDAWARRLSVKYGGMESPKWRREFEIDYDAVRGQPVYPMLSRVHIEQQRLTPDIWSYFRVIDHGIRHPMVCLWVAVNRHGDRYVYREYYRSGTTVEVNSQEVLRRTPDDENVIDTYIDPATKQRVPLSNKDKAPVSVLSLYNEALGLGCKLGDNSRAGYDTVRDGLLSVLARNAVREGILESDSYFAKEYFGEFGLSNSELISLSNKPALTFAPECVRTFKEMRNLRFKEISGDVTQKAKPEEIMDYQDDGPDCVRYAMQSKLYWRPNSSRAEKGSHLYDIAQKRINRNPRYRKRAGYG